MEHNMEHPEETRYTIGQMAKICNMTTKQLRFYDENNILKPIYKDQKTGYRYYNKKQIEEILFLKELKQINFSLSEISEALDQRELHNLKTNLDSQLHVLTAQMQQLSQQYMRTFQFYTRVAGALSLREEGQNEEFSVVSFPEKTVLYTRSRTYWNAQQLFVGRRAEISEIAERYHVPTPSPLLAVFHENYLGQFGETEEDLYGDLELCVPVTDTGDCPPCHLRTFGGFRAVTGIFLGHYKNMKPFYLKMQNWARENGYELEDYSVEEYISGVTLTEFAEEYVTRIYLPIKETAETGGNVPDSETHSGNDTTHTDETGETPCTESV